MNLGAEPRLPDDRRQRAVPHLRRRRPRAVCQQPAYRGPARRAGACAGAVRRRPRVRPAGQRGRDPRRLRRRLGLEALDTTTYRGVVQRGACRSARPARRARGSTSPRGWRGPAGSKGPSSLARAPVFVRDTPSKAVQKGSVAGRFARDQLGGVQRGDRPRCSSARSRSLTPSPADDGSCERRLRCGPEVAVGNREHQRQHCGDHVGGQRERCVDGPRHVPPVHDVVDEVEADRLRSPGPQRPGRIPGVRTTPQARRRRRRLPVRQPRPRHMWPAGSAATASATVADSQWAGSAPSPLAAAANPWCCTVMCASRLAQVPAVARRRAVAGLSG